MHIKRSMARLALEHRQGTLLMSSHVTTASGAPPTVVGESSRISRRWMHSVAPDRAPFFYMVPHGWAAPAGLLGASLNNQELGRLTPETTTFVTDNHLFASPHGFVSVLVVPTNENVGLISHRVKINRSETRDVQMRVYWVAPEVGTVLRSYRAYVPPDVIVFFPLDYDLTCTSTTTMATPSVPTYAVRRVGVVFGDYITFSRFNERVANRRKIPLLMRVLFDVSRAEAEEFFRDASRKIDERKVTHARMVASAQRNIERVRIGARSKGDINDMGDGARTKKQSSTLVKRPRAHSSGFISTKGGNDDDDDADADLSDIVADLQEDSE